MALPGSGHRGQQRCRQLRHCSTIRNSSVSSSRAGPAAPSRSIQPILTAAHYRPNGTVEKITSPAVAGLPAETVTTLFNTMGLPNGLIGKQIYAQEIVYNQFDELIGQNLGEHGSRVALTYGYDDATGRKTTFNAVPELKNDVYSLSYTYDKAGTITAITDTPTPASRPTPNASGTTPSNG